VIQQGLKYIVQEILSSENPALIVHKDDFLTAVKQAPFAIALIHLDSENSHLIHEISLIQQKSPENQFIAIVCENDTTTIEQILQNNLSVCIHLQATTQEWAAAYQAVSDRKRYYSNKILHQALEHKYSNAASHKHTNELTNRQTEILKKIALGYDKHEIGAELNLSHHTVQTHRKNLMKKLGVNSVSGLIIHAIKIGLVSSDQLNSK